MKRSTSKLVLYTPESKIVQCFIKQIFNNINAILVLLVSERYPYFLKESKHIRDRLRFIGR